MDAVFIVSESWEQISSKCLQGVWKKIMSWISDNNINKIATELSNLKLESINICSNLGFNGITLGDINKSIDLKNEEDILHDRSDDEYSKQVSGNEEKKIQKSVNSKSKKCQKD
ncbi:hypothetical protein AYI68_g5231 [Smittium mucronatum]|uniref:Uncharacterized protein n=1 Tax=Smittium mucronatum TaxID=133383 RepID=A0A1R0GUU9_9FUNG|nr:hypothetical protein AYI68_g5231 [Smittium mucronatum]